ncbi:MAG: tripartite tricarboxylate transporter permease [Azospirillaceae bacterium]
MEALFGNLAFGFQVVLSAENFLYCVLGVSVGMAIGVLPGIGPLATISLLLPITFSLDPIASLIMLAGIYYGAMYGGSTASILVNLPGSAPSAVTCLDGYPLARQGRAGPALLMTTIASFVGGTISIIILAAFAPLLAEVAMEFGSPEYFALMSFALVMSAAVSGGSFIRSFGMVLLGVLVGLIGMDVNSGIQRFSFGMLQLADGVNLVIIAMGVFGVAEVCGRLSARLSGLEANEKVQHVTLRSMAPSRDDLSRSKWPILRGTGIGSILGVLPGAGSTLAAFLSYATERRISKEPERFGKGAMEGVAAPEAANNAAAQTAFIPTLTLGVPGDAIMALMLGALLIHGISPGPEVMTTNHDLFWGLVASMWVGNLVLLILNIPLVAIWVSLLRIPYRLLYPAVILLVCLGVYSVKFSLLDVFMVAILGLFGLVFVRLKLEAAPLLLGFILGPLTELHFRRSMILSRGSLDIFYERPVSAVFTTLTLVIIVLLVGRLIFTRSRAVA